MPSLIVVHGAPASGKTWLSQWLAQELHLPLLSKDDIKEALFNHFDYQAAEQSARIDEASYDILWIWQDRYMAARTQSCIVETAFDNTSSQPKLLYLIHTHSYRVVQIFCHADENVLRRRYVDRATSGQRHPGHKDLENVENQPIPDASSFHPMDLPGPLIDLDTSDLDVVDYRGILKKLKGAI